MGRLQELLFQNREFLSQPKPDEFTQRKEALEYEKQVKRLGRWKDFVRKSVRDLGISRKEITSLAMKLTGNKEDALKLIEDAKKRETYPDFVIKFLKEMHPDVYQAADQAGIKNAKDLVAYAEKHLPKAQLEKIHMICVVHEMTMDRYLEAFYQNLEGCLTPEHQEALIQKLGTYRDVMDIPLEEREEHYLKPTVDALRAKADTELAQDEEKRRRYLNVLDFANQHVTRLPFNQHEELREMDKAVQHLGAVAHKQSVSRTAKTFQNGHYDNIFRSYRDLNRERRVFVVQDKEEVIQDIGENGIRISDSLREGTKKLIKKMQEMQILKPGEQAPGEDPHKIYVFRQYLERKGQLTKALESGDPDRIIEAGEAFEKCWNDLEELYQIARENLNCDPSLYPGNLDSCRNENLPAHFTFDQATTAAINGAFLVYNIINSQKLDVDEYLNNPLKAAFDTVKKDIRDNCLDGITSGKPFEDTVDALYDFNGSRKVNFFTKTVNMGVSRSVEYFNFCDPDQEKQQENMIREEVYDQYTTALVGHKNDEFGIMKELKAPETRQRILQNVIAVKHGTLPLSQLISEKNIKNDLFRGEDFSLDYYVATNVDYEGMIQRTETLLAKVAGKDAVYTEDILEAAQELYAKVLLVHAVNRDDDGYLKLREHFLSLESRLPQTAGPEIRNRMATRRQELEMTLPEGPATSQWTAVYFDQLAEKGEPLSEENKNQLKNVTDALQELKRITAPFNTYNEQGLLPTVRAEDVSGLLDAYVRVTNAIDGFHPQADHEAAANVAQMLGGLKKVLGQDMTALSAAKQGRAQNLPDMLKEGRSLKVTVKGPITTVGDMASSRMRIDVPGPDGQPVKGFFTANIATYTQEQGMELARNAIDHAVSKYGHPELREAVEILFKGELGPFFQGQPTITMGQGDSIFKIGRAFLKTADHSQMFDELIQNYLEELGDKRAESLRTEAGACIIMDVLKELSPLSMEAAYKIDGLHGNIDRRNSAMSTVAELLGVGNVIAGSRPMTIVHEGKEITGTFMNFAEGWDPDDMNPANPLMSAGPEDMITTESLESLANLQALDFICGNVDRHSGNMFYKFDNGKPPKFLGVQGIDNDYSFCLYEGHNMVFLDNLSIIPEKTAQKIMSLTPALLEVTLSPYGLSKEEIDAAWNRTHRLQERITSDAEYFLDKPADYVEKGHIRVVKEDDLKAFGPTSMLYEKGLFDRAQLAPIKCVEREVASQEKQLDQRYISLRESAPDIERILNGVEDANRGLFIGSSAYRNALNSIREIAAARKGALEGADPQKLTEYNQRLEDGKQLIANYLIGKAGTPEDQRTKLEKRRIEAMSLAYSILDRESVTVAGAADLAAKVAAQKNKTSSLYEKDKNLSSRKEIVKLHITAREEKREMMEPLDAYEGKIMKGFREQAAEIMYNLQSTYNGEAPTEEMLATIPDKLATCMTYRLLKMHIRPLNDEQKQGIYRKLDEHPEILEKLKGAILKSEAFQYVLEERFNSNREVFAKGIQGGLGRFAGRIQEIQKDITRELTAQLAEKQPAPEPVPGQEQPVSKVENPSLNVPG